MLLLFTDTDKDVILSIQDLNRMITGPAWNYRSKWKYIGRALDIDEGTLNAIEGSKRHVVDDCFTEVIATWLRSATPRQTNLDKALLSPGVQCKGDE